MTDKPKGERVWVAVYIDTGERAVDRMFRTRRDALAWADNAPNITIRRGTLILDPVKPKRRKA